MKRKIQTEELSSPCRTRAVLWDLDGVLADTWEAHYQTWLIALTPLGIAFDRDIFSRTFGMDNAHLLEAVAGKPVEADFVARVGAMKEAQFREIIHGRLKTFPGVFDWLKTLRRQGFLQAVASSAPEANLEAMLDELELRPFFNAWVCAESLPGKPDPAVFQEAARRLGVEPGECVVVEDSPPGVQAAHAAGMRCLAVAHTVPASFLSAAERVADSLLELSLQDFCV